MDQERRRIGDSTVAAALRKHLSLRLAHQRHDWSVVHHDAEINYFLPFDSLFTVDYSLFSGSDFEPNEYPNTILATDHHPEFKHGSRPATPLKTPTHGSIVKEDISIKDVLKQIRNLI